MAVDVKFYIFPKKINSTKQPDDTTTSITYSCNMLDDCSIISPKISIVGADNTFNPSIYNYAFIADFDGRFYFVSDWVYSNRVWNAILTEDVLASWRGSIGESVQYITRGSNSLLEYVGERFQDAQYPASVIYNSQAEDYSNMVGGGNYISGCVILGVLGDSTSRFGASYYAFYAPTFEKFISILFSSDTWTTLINSLVNPLQYIITCKWIPLYYTVFETEKPVLDIKIGNTTVSLPQGSICYSIDDPVKNITIDFTLTQHPLTSRGAYLSTSPFTVRTLYWAPIGQIQLDTSVLSNSTTAKMRLYVDIITGQCIYDVRKQDNGDGSRGDVVAIGNSKLAVELPLSHITIDALGTASNILSMATNGFAGNLAGMASSAVSMGGSLLPKVAQSGGIGSFAAYFKSTPVIISEFYHQANIWPERFGWYTGGIYDTISNYPGFIKTENADIQIAGTDEEINKINDFMNGGFYYE